MYASTVVSMSCILAAEPPTWHRSEVRPLVRLGVTRVFCKRSTATDRWKCWEYNNFNKQQQSNGAQLLQSQCQLLQLCNSKRLQLPSNCVCSCMWQCVSVQPAHLVCPLCIANQSGCSGPDVYAVYGLGMEIAKKKVVIPMPLLILLINPILYWFSYWCIVSACLANSAA